jgi:hypothetical protein
MADLKFYIDHARTPFGPTMRIFKEGEAPDLEPVREEPPSAQEVSAALIQSGCTSALAWTENVIVGHHEDGSTIKASRAPGGWLLTGGPRDLLNYGVPDAAALERFPSVLASVQEHARNMRSPDGAA